VRDFISNGEFGLGPLAAQGGAPLENVRGEKKKIEKAKREGESQGKVHPFFVGGNL